jgi:hypothetical protein
MMQSNPGDKLQTMHGGDMNKVVFAFLAAAGLAVSGFTQTVNISGKVTNTSGQPVQAAIVKIFSTPLACTTMADGAYLLSGQYTNAATFAPAQTGVNNIEYRNQSFFFTVPAPAAVDVKLYDLAGRMISHVFNGRLNQGATRVPFSLNRFSQAIFFLRIKSSNATATYTLNRTAGERFIIHQQQSQMARALSKTAALDWLQAGKTGYQTKIKAIDSYTGVVNCTLSTIAGTPNFGPNVHIFDPSMSMSTIQSQVDALNGSTGQFSSQRTAYLFKPGNYSLAVTVNYYIQAYGLGMSPEDVQIVGAMQALVGGTGAFWRGLENMSVDPTGGPIPGTSIWAVSQATPFRRMHIKGKMNLSYNNGSSGGFIADCKIDDAISPGSQQQFYFRNNILSGWSGGNWNMLFQGCNNPPPENYPTGAVTVLAKTPLVREKPFLTIDGAGNYSVFVPALRTNSQGASWYNATPAGELLPIDQFYVTVAGTDSAATMNAALAQGKNLLITPGIYSLDAPLLVQRPKTVVLGLGMATLKPQNGVIAMKTGDAGGITIANILFDAGPVESPVLLQVGDSGSVRDHSADPQCIFDLFIRIGGAGNAQAKVGAIFNCNNTILDHCWIWRADHGAGAGWTTNPARNGLIVNGNNCITYGQMVEHFQQHQTIWNGNNGQTYFYQCEYPYDVAQQSDFNFGNELGYPAYYVTKGVTNFVGWSLGIYSYFNRAPITVTNAMEVPRVPGAEVHHIVTYSLGSDQGTILHAINDTGATAKWGVTPMIRFGDYVGH